MIERTPVMLAINYKDKKDWTEKYYRNIVIGQGAYVHQLLNYYYYIPLFSESVQKECNLMLSEMIKDFYNDAMDRYLSFMEELGNGMTKITEDEFRELVDNATSSRVGIEEIFWNVFNAVASMPIDIQSSIWMELSVKMMEFEDEMKSRYAHEIDKLGIKFSLLGGDNVEIM